LFFLRNKKNTDVILIKNVGHVFCQMFPIMVISVGLPVAVNNPVPASQVGFQQFRAIERFCV